MMNSWMRTSGFAWACAPEPHCIVVITGRSLPFWLIHNCQFFSEHVWETCVWPSSGLTSLNNLRSVCRRKVQNLSYFPSSSSRTESHWLSFSLVLLILIWFLETLIWTAQVQHHIRISMSEFGGAKCFSFSACSLTSCQISLCTFCLACGRGDDEETWWQPTGDARITKWCLLTR